MDRASVIKLLKDAINAMQADLHLLEVGAPERSITARLGFQRKVTRKLVERISV